MHHTVGIRNNRQLSIFDLSTKLSTKFTNPCIYWLYGTYKAGSTPVSCLTPKPLILRHLSRIWGLFLSLNYSLKTIKNRLFFIKLHFKLSMNCPRKCQKSGYGFFPQRIKKRNQMQSLSWQNQSSVRDGIHAS